MHVHTPCAGVACASATATIATIGIGMAAVRRPANTHTLWGGAEVVMSAHAPRARAAANGLTVSAVRATKTGRCAGQAATRWRGRRVEEAVRACRRASASTPNLHHDIDLVLFKSALLAARKRLFTSTLLLQSVRAAAVLTARAALHRSGCSACRVHDGYVIVPPATGSAARVQATPTQEAKRVNFVVPHKTQKVFLTTLCKTRCCSARCRRRGRRVAGEDAAINARAHGPLRWLQGGACGLRRVRERESLVGFGHFLVSRASSTTHQIQSCGRNHMGAACVRRGRRAPCAREGTSPLTFAWVWPRPSPRPRAVGTAFCKIDLRAPARDYSLTPRGLAASHAQSTVIRQAQPPASWRAPRTAPLAPQVCRSVSVHTHGPPGR